MAFSLSDLKRRTADSPPRLLFYGPPGIGKTTLATEFPDAAMIRTEDGIPGTTSVVAFPLCATFADVMEQLAVLYTEEHDRRTVILDSVTELQRLVFAETCERHSKPSIEAFGYGKGYVEAKAVMAEVLDALHMLRTERGMTAVLIAHSATERFDDPDTTSYDRYVVDLHKQMVGMVERDMDAILLLKRPVVVEEEERGFSGKRTRAKNSRVVMMHAVGSPAFVAKNRFGIPAETRFDEGEGYAALAPYLPTHDLPTHADGATEKEAA